MVYKSKKTGRREAFRDLRQMWRGGATFLILLQAAGSGELSPSLFGSLYRHS